MSHSTNSAATAGTSSSQQHLRDAMQFGLEGHATPCQIIRQIAFSQDQETDAPAHTLECMAVIDNYDCSINSLDSLELENPSNGHDVLACLESEWGHDGLAKFLNACLAACRAALGDMAKQANLNFFVWDGPQKPDEVFWSLTGSAPQVIIPLVTNTSPLCQFALVVGYKHTKRLFRIRLFHRGGLTASEDLNPFDSDGRKDILRLLLSILTWKCRADAWCNEANIFLPGPEGATEIFVFDIESVLNTRKCVSARSPCVFHIWFASSGLDSVNPVEKPSAQQDEPSYSKRDIQRHPETPKEFQSLPGVSGAKSSTSKAKPISISQSRTVKVEPLVLVNETFVIKSSWTSTESRNNTTIELRLLRQCRGMFGVPRNLYSFRAHHNDACYYNMCQKYFLHRDISIGNVLMVEQRIKCEPFTIQNPNEIQTEILEVCTELGISDKHYGILIDGDMIIDWSTYFDEKYDGSNSGTPEFMSNALLEQDDGIIHSPVDDYWSFYFTTQWACVFRKALPGEALGDPKKLEYLRSLLAGGTASRALGTNSIVDYVLRERYHGSFLTNIQLFLREWNRALKELWWEWQDPE
ncbi:hypothetical protein BT96DRAFT_981911, partial [Gymnopus androsaceus JB14]